MAKIEALSVTTVTINSVDYHAFTEEFGFKHSKELHDVTTVGVADKVFFPGLKGGDSFSFNIFFDDTNTTGPVVLLTAIFLGSVPVTFSLPVGGRTFAGNLWIKDIGMSVKVNSMVMYNLTVQLDGAVAYS